MKKFLIIVCVIGVIIFLCYIGKDMNLSNVASNNTTNNTTNSSVITGKNTTTNNSKNTTKNEINKTNNVEKNTTNETENSANQTSNKTENKTDNKTENKVKNGENNVEEVKISDEDKAKELAKKTYGSSDGVYFKVEQAESNGVYIISVRDAETTNALAWYKVDVNNQTVK